MNLYFDNYFNTYNLKILKYFSLNNHHLNNFVLGYNIFNFGKENMIGIFTTYCNEGENLEKIDHLDTIKMINYDANLEEKVDDNLIKIIINRPSNISKKTGGEILSENEIKLIESILLKIKNM